MQGLELDSPLSDPIGVEGDPVVVDTQTADSLVRHTTDGNKIIHPFFSFCNDYELIIFLDTCRYQC